MKSLVQYTFISALIISTNSFGINAVYNCTNTSVSGTQINTQLKIDEAKVAQNIDAHFIHYIATTIDKDQKQSQIQKTGFATLTILENKHQLLKIDTLAFEFDENNELQSKNCQKQN